MRDNILYIIVIVIYVLYSLYKGFQKKVSTSTKPINPIPNHPKDVLTRKAKDKVRSYREKETFSYSENKTTLENISLESLENSENISNFNNREVGYSAKHKISSSTTTADEEGTDQVSFNLKQAVIQSAILNRPYAD